MATLLFKQQIYTIICLGSSQVCMLTVVETRVLHLSPVCSVETDTVTKGNGNTCTDRLITDNQSCVLPGRQE